ncbi:MAG: hypothetical protein ACF8XB_10935 [Planctomycetota bacterium JB042]
MTARGLLLCVLAPIVGGALAVLLHDPSPAAAPTVAPPPAAPAVAAAPDADDREDGPTSGPAEPPPAPEAAPAPTERTSVWANAAAWLEREMPFEAVGTRYRVWTDVSVGTARRALRVLEPLHATFVERFGADAVASTPDGRLPILVYGSRRKYAENPVAEGTRWPVDADGDPYGGFYDHRGNVHVSYGDGAGFERLCVHEAAHQFQALAAATPAAILSPFWWVEGVAHDLQYPRDDDVTPSERERALLRAAAAYLHRVPDWTEALRGRPLPRAESETERRGVGFVLVRYLRTGEDGRYAEWFRTFERTMARGGPLPRPPATGREANASFRESVVRFTRALRHDGRATSLHYRVDGGDGAQLRTTRGTATRAALGKGPWRDETTLVRFSLVHPLRSGDEIGVAIGERGDGVETVVRFDHHASVVTIERRRGDGSSATRDLRSAGVRVLTGGDRYAVSSDGDGPVRVEREGLTIGTGVLDLAPGRGTVSLFARAGDLAEDHAAFRLAGVSIETARTTR